MRFVTTSRRNGRKAKQRNRARERVVKEMRERIFLASLLFA
jgi:hypothetical protein